MSNESNKDNAPKLPKKKDYYETIEGRSLLTYFYRDLMMTDEQVANEIGISSRTIRRWRDSSPIIDKAIEIGKAHTDTLVENSLLQQALKENVNAAIYWLQVQPAINSTITLREQTSYQINAYKNRLLFAGDPSELEQFFMQTANDQVTKARFWASGCINR